MGVREVGWVVGKEVNWKQVKPPLGMFGLAMTSITVSHTPNMLRESKRCLTITGMNFRPMPSSSTAAVPDDFLLSHLLHSAVSQTHYKIRIADKIFVLLLAVPFLFRDSCWLRHWYFILCLHFTHSQIYPASSYPPP